MNDSDAARRFSAEDEGFMRLALEQAELAAREGEIPVGAVCVWDGKVISAAHNRREADRNALRHAELDAIDAACKALGGWRLWKCDLYVTLEPCPMCAGAAINSRIRRVVFGASDAKAGSCGSVADLFALPYNHHPKAEGGCLESECAALLSEFFRNIRSAESRPSFSVTPMTSGFCADVEKWLGGADADFLREWSGGIYEPPFTAGQMAERTETGEKNGTQIFRIARKGKTVGVVELTGREDGVLRLERFLTDPSMREPETGAEMLRTFRERCRVLFGECALELHIPPCDGNSASAALAAGFEQTDGGIYVLCRDGE